MNRSKRQRILAGILEEVGSEGYEATSVRSVLDRTGLYRQAFYDSFSSKEDCFAQAYEERLGELEEEVGAAADGGEWAEQLRLGLIAILDFLDAEPLVGRALVVEVHAAGGRPVALRTAAFARACEFLGRGRGVASNGQAPPAIAPEAIAAGIHAVLHSRLAAGKRGGFRPLLGELMYVAVLPYFGAETALAEMRR